MIIIGLLAVLAVLYAFSESPLLALLVFGIFGFVLWVIMKYEHRRIEREMPPED
jgi:hypothetical protein